MKISHLLLVHFIDTICLKNEYTFEKCCANYNFTWICLKANQSTTVSNVNGRATSDQIDVLEDLTQTFSNVNDRATSDQIEALEDRIETLLSNMTLFEITPMGK